MQQFWGYVAILIAASGCGSSKPSKGEPASGGSNVGGSSGEGGSAEAAGSEAGAIGMRGDRGCSSGDINLLATQVSGTISVNGALLTDPTTQGEGILILLRSDGVDYARLSTTAAVGGA